MDIGTSKYKSIQQGDLVFVDKNLYVVTSPVEVDKIILTSYGKDLPNITLKLDHIGYKWFVEGSDKQPELKFYTEYMPIRISLTEQFTGNPDIDANIALRLNDEDLSAFMSTYKYIYNLTSSDDFWLNKIFTYFESLETYGDRNSKEVIRDIVSLKPNDKTYRQQYKDLKIVEEFGIWGSLIVQGRLDLILCHLHYYVRGNFEPVAAVEDLFHMLFVYGTVDMFIFLEKRGYPMRNYLKLRRVGVDDLIGMDNEKLIYIIKNSGIYDINLVTGETFVNKLYEKYAKIKTVDDIQKYKDIFRLYQMCSYSDDVNLLEFALNLIAYSPMKILLHMITDNGSINEITMKNLRNMVETSTGFGPDLVILERLFKANLLTDKEMRELAILSRNKGSDISIIEWFEGHGY